MPIALFVAPRVEEILQARFGEVFISLRQTSLSATDPKTAVEKLIVQLDVQPDNLDKGNLPGLHWLEDLLAEKRIPASTPILITAWDHDLFADGSAVRFRTRIGAHPRSNLLYSPLVHFLDLNTLLNKGSLPALLASFPSIDPQKVRHPERLLEDIASNCYVELGISSRCHRLRHMVVDYWQANPDFSGEDVYRRFHKDITALYKVVLQNTTRKPIELGVVKQIQYHLGYVRKTTNLADFLHCFTRLEDILIELEKKPRAIPVKPLSSHIILISHDPHFSSQFKRQLLSKWAVNCDVVADYEEAERLLEESPNKYSSLLSNFRNNTPNGKMDFYQGYENLYSAADKYPWLSCAFMTSMRGARWEQPGSLTRWVFEKPELSDLDKKSAYAFYFFLREAEAKRRGRVQAIPKFLLQGQGVFRDITKPEMADKAYDYLEAQVEQAKECIKGYCEGGNGGYDWSITTRYRAGDEQYLFQRLYYRLVVLALLRQEYRVDGLAPVEDKERKEAVHAFLWKGQEFRGRECSEYLRIRQDVKYHQVPLEKLYQDELLFHHEVVLLPRLEISLPILRSAYGSK